jgi:hypothetical protein
MHAGLCEIAAIYVAIGIIQVRGAGIPAETIVFGSRTPVTTC